MLENCQVLQTAVNRSKSNKVGLSFCELRGSASAVLYSKEEMDFLEKAVYGNLSRPPFEKEDKFEQ